MSRGVWTPAAARRDLAVLCACVVAGAWLAPLLSPPADRVAVVASGTVGLVWALLAVWQQGATPGDLGLRADDLLRSGPAFLACALATVAAFALAGKIDPASPGRLAEPGAVASYALWAVFQQFLVVSMLWRHARALLGGGEPERMLSVANLRLALVASFAFALVHAPNGRLMALVFAAEMVWLVLFARFRNLFALALAHAISALAVAEALQPHWLPTARVGLTYWQR